VGSDANACTRTAPCQTFAGAISKTAASGEIDCLDPGGFGAVTITKAITLFCSGLGNGGVLAASGSGVTVNAGVGDVVVIDGLDIDGAGATGQFGINFIAGNSLIVRNTVIRNFAQAGIEFAPAVSATLTVDHATITNVGYNGGYGAINVQPASAAVVRASVSHSQFSNNSFGVEAFSNTNTGSVFIDVRDTSITNSGNFGVANNNQGTALFSTITLDGVTVSGSGSYGLWSSGPHTRIMVNNSNILDNLGGGVVPFLGGLIYSYGNNRVDNLGNDGTFSGTKPTR
jgi:hypothetical protein